MDRVVTGLCPGKPGGRYDRVEQPGLGARRRALNNYGELALRIRASL